MNDRAKELEDVIVAAFDYGGGIVCPVTGCAGDAAFGGCGDCKIYKLFLIAEEIYYRKDLLMKTYEFAYRIDKRVKLAYDPDTGEPGECYAKIRMNMRRDITPKEYEIMHEEKRSDLGLDIPIEYITPISMDEYWQETEEEAK